jgi:anti-sigma-K factor RskA
MTDATHIPGEEDALAAELALRVLSRSEEAAARARAARDPAFAADVQAWDEHLAGLADEIAPVEPSPHVWPRVEAGIAPVANDNGRAVFWRRWAIGSTGLLAASVAALAVVASRPPEVVTAAPPGGVTRVATLNLEGGVTAVTLAYDSATGELFIAPGDEMVGDQRVPHLWLMMPEGGVQLVGAIDGVHTSRHNLKGQLAGMAGQAAKVAISMEAPGHTPAANKPDGPVVASGDLQQL